MAKSKPVDQIADTRPGPDAETMQREESALEELRRGGISTRRLAVLIQSFPPRCMAKLCDIVLHADRYTGTAEEIARECGISRSSAYRFLAKARRAWRQLALESRTRG